MAERRRRDPARDVALRLLRAVDERGAYANLTLPELIRQHGLDVRDAALATELGYGTLRAAGVLDLIIAECAARPLPQIEAMVRDVLRLGVYQQLRTRIPSHAAVSTTVDLARSAGRDRATGFVNAVLRRTGRLDWEQWTERLGRGFSAVSAAAIRHSHPAWIAEAFAEALGERAGELDAALAADDERPLTHLVAWPGRIERDELAALTGGRPGPYSPYAVHLVAGGDPARVPAVRERRAAVQDEGSQLCVQALVDAPLSGRDERWLDLCAGPGGKAALLAALGAVRGARLNANELRPHRADLVRRATTPWDVDVSVGDARDLAAVDGDYDRVLLDAPCTGLGALRRRPEARWRRTPDDLTVLTMLQSELLTAALRLTRPGGVVAYVTCSPHEAETVEVIERSGAEVIDARPVFAGVPELGGGPMVQLWPHRQGTDAMFCALLRG